DVEIAQANVGIDEHDRVPELRERRAEVGCGGRLADAAFAGCDDDGSTHDVNSLEAGGQIAGKLAEVAFDDDLVAGAVCDFRFGGGRVAVGRARDLAADAQLLRLEAQRHDETDFLPDAGVRGAAQTAEDDDVAGRADIGARVDVAEDDEVTEVL